MALIDLPPELRTICRRLTSTKAEHLPPLLPVLLKDIARCQEPLSQPAEPKASTDAVVLVHKLKTQISSLLKGRVSQGHFVAVFLVKAVVEAGGWECLRASEPWVKDLISILQKKGPAATKEICVVTLTKIYTLMHNHPTLVREILTPTLPAFTAACLQILKPPPTSRAGKAPYGLVEAIFQALSTLIPNHPTTLRQSAGKIRAETRMYLAPTSSDGVIVPASLQKSGRQLAVRLHMTAAKGSDSTEWTKHVEELVSTFHATADQVLRAVQENWESTSGYRPQPVNFDTEPHGGSDNADQLPSWSGVQAGSERMVGLLDFIGDFLSCRTRVPVTIPVGAILDITLRMSSIQPPSTKKGRVESVQMNPSAGREERDELWAAFPDIQVSVMRLLITMILRLGRNFVSLAQQTLDQVFRIFESAYRLPQAREVAFTLVKEILLLCGPTLPKLTVDNLALVTRSCCRDLLGAAGYLKKPKPHQGSAAATQNGTKPKTVSQNADAFLPGKAQDEMVSVSLSRGHLAAAEALLVVLFSHLPQQHIMSSLRSQMLRTAILSRNRDAQVASVLHPARDRSGRTPQVILPYLTQQFPRDEAVEILRFSFRPIATGMPSDFMEEDDNDAMVLDEDEEDNNKASAFGNNTGPSFGRGSNTHFPTNAFASTIQTEPEPTATTEPSTNQGPPAVDTAVEPQSTSSELQAEPSPWGSFQEPADKCNEILNMLKRKHDPTETMASKRRDLSEGFLERDSDDDAAVAATMAGTMVSLAVMADQERRMLESERDGDGDSDDDDDESVHLNMELDSDDGDEDEDEEV